jgi:hypothetical protein
MGKPFVPEYRESKNLLKRLQEQHERGDMFSFEVGIKQILKNQITIMEHLRENGN